MTPWESTSIVTQRLPIAFKVVNLQVLDIRVYIKEQVDAEKGNEMTG
jgi:hypothetical protein